MLAAEARLHHGTLDMQPRGQSGLPESARAKEILSGGLNTIRDSRIASHGARHKRLLSGQLLYVDHV